MIVLLLYVSLIEENRFLSKGVFLADQNSYELVELHPSEEPPSLRQVPRLKQSASDGMSCSISFIRVRVCFILVGDVYM